MELEPALFSLQTSQVRPWEASQDSSRGPGQLGSAARTPPSLGSPSRSHTLRRSLPAGLPAWPLLPNLFSPCILAFCFFHRMSPAGRGGGRWMPLKSRASHTGTEVSCHWGWIGFCALNLPGCREWGGRKDLIHGGKSAADGHRMCIGQKAGLVDADDSTSLI